jgi:hypothetical protein
MSCFTLHIQTASSASTCASQKTLRVLNIKKTASSVSDRALFRAASVAVWATVTWRPQRHFLENLGSWNVTQTRLLYNLQGDAVQNTSLYELE